MVLAGKLKNNGGAGGGEGWRTDIFLVFFPQENQQELTSSSSSFSSSSSSSLFKFPTINSLLKRTNSSHILTRTQSTISICALLIFLTFLFFTLSTFEPNNNFTSSRRRSNLPRSYYKPALQGLGTLYTRGTTAMDNLLLCHVTESVTTKEIKLFLRAFHRSGLPSSSDLLFIFDSISTPESFDNVIREENDIFLKIVGRYRSELCNGSKVLDFPASFNVTEFVNSGKKVVEKGETIWGWRIKNNNSSLIHCGGGGGGETESTRMSYGSVVGFGVGELDPENSLSGFMDRIPMSLRRWASYPMILGRVRRNFKHVMLVDVKKVLLLGDPLGRVKNKTPDSVFLSSSQPPPHTAKHGHKSSENSRQKTITINPAVIMGGLRGIRRLSAAMLTEIVRSTATNQQHNKRKNISVMESGLLSRLATNEFTLKSVHVSLSAESIPSSVSESTIFRNKTMVWIEYKDYKDIESVIMKHICSFAIDSGVYMDCCKKVEI